MRRAGGGGSSRIRRSVWRGCGAAPPKRPIPAIRDRQSRSITLPTETPPICHPEGARAPHRTRRPSRRRLKDLYLPPRKHPTLNDDAYPRSRQTTLCQSTSQLSSKRPPICHPEGADAQNPDPAPNPTAPEGSMLSSAQGPAADDDAQVRTAGVCPASSIDPSACRTPVPTTYPPVRPQDDSG